MEIGKKYKAELVLTFLGGSSGPCGLCGSSGGGNLVNIEGAPAGMSFICSRCMEQLKYEELPSEPDAAV